MKTIRKLLIANRGEIACRIARTARRLAIKTVAVYSDADEHARHVAECDEAIRIGPPPPRESYLQAEAIIEAARATGADAIHPGYGFLSENADFAQLCADSDLIFVGPPPAAIRAMGSKSSAKQLMEQASVPLTPGYHGAEQGAAFLAQEAARIGYPVLIKASAGGGGKGMRRVDQASDFEDALASCKREAAASFKDDRVLVERYVTKPRHIEIQVFADSHGNCVYLFERDCSVQRRHQKVIEEAPAPGMTPQRRRRMGEAAVAAARAVGYVGAGTVEFISAEDATFYFMEMNTRLQVEHPVTEMITGQDLVEWQLRVAMGEALPLAQEQLSIRGHALEARIYAEDPDREFLPSIGTLRYLRAPLEGEHVRVDTGAGQGDTISPHYDPMIAKLIVWDESRPRALRRMLQALQEYLIVGVTTNVEFLQRIVTSESFATANLDTGLIERERGHLLPPSGPPPLDVWWATAFAVSMSRPQAVDSPWLSQAGWRVGAPASTDVTLQFHEERRTVRITHVGDARSLEWDGKQARLHSWSIDGDKLRINIDGHSVDLNCYLEEGHCTVFVDGAQFRFALVDPRQYAGEAAVVAGGLRSPMPGKVIALLVKVGDRVAKGTRLVVLEAMKMEHAVTAPFDGTVTAIKYGVGELVSDGAELAVLERTSALNAGTIK